MQSKGAKLDSTRSAQPGDAPQASHHGLDLREQPWWRRQVIERLRDAALTPRERVVLSLWSYSYRRLTAWWLTVLVGLTACSIFAMVRTEPPEYEQPAMWALLVLVWSRYAWVHQDSVAINGEYGRNIGCLPIVFSEVCRAAWKQEIIRTATAAPLFAAYGLLISPFFSLPRWHGILYGLSPILAIWAVQPSIDAFKLGFSTSSATRIRFWLCWLCVVLALGSSILISVIARALLAQYLSLAAVGLVSALIWWCYNRAYRLGKLDLAREARG